MSLYNKIKIFIYQHVLKKQIYDDLKYEIGKFHEHRIMLLEIIPCNIPEYDLTYSEFLEQYYISTDERFKIYLFNKYDKYGIMKECIDILNYEDTDINEINYVLSILHTKSLITGFEKDYYKKLFNIE